MKQPHDGKAFLRKIQLFPLSLLSLSRGKRLLIVLLSYGLAIPGLWFFFPRLHNAASMLVSIICLCWLFRYRGLLISIFSTALAMGLIYYYLLGERESSQMLVERVVLGLGISLLLGLTICWLRTAVDLMHEARQQALAAQQERLQALEAERYSMLAYERQRQVNELQEQFLLLFEKFVRLKRDVGGSTSGTGLGLYICKRLVEAMDGHIWVESSGRRGEGSRFSITLPPIPSCPFP